MNTLSGYRVDPISGQVHRGSVRWEGDRLTGGGEEETPGDPPLLLPGRVCGHTELSLSLLPGMPRREGEGEGAWRSRYLGALDPASLKAAARLGAAQAAQAGFTLVCDLSRANVEGALEIIGEALGEVGLRGVLALDVSDGDRNRMEAAAAFHRGLGDSGMLRGMMGLAEPSQLGGEALAAAISRARQAEMGFHVLLEESAEARRRLYEKGAIRPGSIAVASPLDSVEQALLRDLHAWQAGPGPLLPLDRGSDLVAVHFDRPFGRFSAGAPADLVAFEPELAAPVMAATLEAHLGALSPRNLREMVVAGSRVIGEGRLRTADVREIRAKAQEALRPLWVRAA